MSKNFSDFNFTSEKATNLSQEQKAIDSFNELKGLDQKTLEEKLFKEVETQKAANSFDYNMLLSTVESMKAFMPDETYRGLRNLLEKIK